MTHERSESLGSVTHQQIYLVITKAGNIHQAYEHEGSAKSVADKVGGKVMPVVLRLYKTTKKPVQVTAAPSKQRKKPKDVLLDLMPKARGGFL